MTWLPWHEPTAPLFETDTLADAGAVISRCGRYRYRLNRKWKDGLPTLAFVMLNPSTAHATQDDPTIRKCVGFAKRWGYGSIVVVNLYAFRSTDPDGLLLEEEDYIGPDNDEHIATVTSHAGGVVVAWGAHKAANIEDRAESVLDLITRRFVDVRAMCLGMTASGAPRHPLMAAYATPLVPFKAQR